MPGRHLTDCQVRRYMNLRTKGPAVGGCGRRQGGGQHRHRLPLACVR